MFDSKGWEVVTWLPTIILGCELLLGGAMWGTVAAGGRSEAVIITMYVLTGILLAAALVSAVLFGILAWQKRMFPTDTTLWNILSWYPMYIFLLWFCLSTSWVSSPTNQWNAGTNAGIADTANPGSDVWTVAWRLLFTSLAAINGIGTLAYVPTGTLAEALMASSLVLWWITFFMFMVTGLNLLVSNRDKSRRHV